MCGLCGHPETVHYATEPNPDTDVMLAPTMTLSQIIWQLTTQWSGSHEGTTRTWGSSVITYSMPNTSPSGSEALGFTPMTEVMKAAGRLSFELWDDLIAIDLVETTSPTANITMAMSSNTGNSTYASSSISGWAPNYTLTSGKIWLASQWSSHNEDSDFVFGNYSYLTYIHEIGHTLGLSHPGTYNGTADYDDDAEYNQDTHQWTVMSYFYADENGSGVDHYGSDGGWKYPSTPMLHDVAAIQDKYGADYTTRTGDTVYGFNVTADKAVFDFTVNYNPIICIWDAGGNDTLDVSGYSTNQRITLEAGTYSDVGYMTQNVAIAYGAWIENAIGGSGADHITGNALANVLSGNGGADTLIGGLGNDTLNGGAGNDLYVFAAGDGHDVIEGFTAGGSEDRIEVTGFASAVIQQEGADLRVVLDANNSILLKGVSAAAFTAADLNIAFTTGTTGPNIINGLATSETLTGTSGKDEIYGNGGDDTLIGLGDDDLLEGGANNDILRGGAGNDILVGGSGVDRADYSDAASGVSVNLGLLGAQDTGGAGTDTLSTIENLTGSNHADVLTGDGNANQLEGGAGNDRLDGRGGADTTFGGLGDDWHYVDNAGDVIEEAAGQGNADRVFAQVSYVLTAGAEIELLSTNLQTGTAAINLTGNALNQSVIGNDGANRLDGGAGHDSLYGHGGDDVMIGGLGDDLIDGGLGTDTADYSAASSAVTVSLLLQSATGGAGADTVRDIEAVIGSAFNDVLRGNSGANSLTGGSGNDILDGFHGIDRTEGGLGNDWHYVDNAADTVIEAAGQGTEDRVFASVSYVLAAGAEIEILSTTLHVGTGAINLTGNAFNQALAGNNGANRLDGGAGDDVLYGHDADDVLIGGLGSDRLDGGRGTDTADYSGTGSAVTANLFTQSATGGAGTDVLLDIENLIGTGFNDVLTGNGSNNVLTGGSGNDRLDGRDGADTSDGGLGDDWHYVDNGGDVVIDAAGQGAGDRVFASASYVLTAAAEIEILSTALQAGTGAINLTGNGFSQTVVGNHGANRLDGGGGNDTLYGHNGADVLIGGAGDDVLDGGLGADEFLFNAGSFGADRVVDFTNGVDHIRISGIAGVNDFSDLSVTANGSGWAVITLPDGSSITLQGVNTGLVDASDFLFGGG